MRVNMTKEKVIKFYIFPAIIAIIFLLLTFFDWPYSFYSILRIVVTIVAVYYAYYLYEVLKRTDFWFWALVGIAILFNPIFPIYLSILFNPIFPIYLYDKTAWGIIDIIVAIFFVILIVKFKKK